MKKSIIALLTTGALCLTLAACAPAQDKASAPPDGQNASQGANAQGNEVTNVVYGKVKDLVGNEFKLELAKPPELPETEGESGGEGGETAAMTMTEAIPAKEGEAPPAAGNDSTTEQKMQLDYTGETKDISLPSGTPVYNTKGEELKSTDLKDGTVLSIVYNKDGTIADVMILE